MSQRSNHPKWFTPKFISFTAGVLITGFVGAFIGLITWGLVKASHVPVLEKKVDTQFDNMNQNIVSLNDTGKETNQRIGKLTDQLSSFATALVVTQHELQNTQENLQRIEEECDLNTKIIMKNKHNHIPGQG